MSQTIEVTCALIQRGASLLLARRADSGRWELPGGKREPGESLAQCLQREIAEELGCRVQVLEPAGQARDMDRPDPIVLHCFRCRLNGGEPQAKEHKELRWVSLSEALALDLCPADRELLHLLNDRN
jgi:8-oxo-dGTP diphosphatase